MTLPPDPDDSYARPTMVGGFDHLHPLAHAGRQLPLV